MIYDHQPPILHNLEFYCVCTDEIAQHEIELTQNDMYRVTTISTDGCVDNPDYVIRSTYVVPFGELLEFINSMESHVVSIDRIITKEKIHGR
jgi:hypothetical protein